MLCWAQIGGNGRKTHGFVTFDAVRYQKKFLGPRDASSHAQDYREYFKDPVVREAYINVMSEVASIPSEMINLEMNSQQLGYIIVTYVITIPYTSQGVPTIPIHSLEEKLGTMEIPTFNDMLEAEMNRLAGEGKYIQTVLNVALDAWLRTGCTGL